MFSATFGAFALLGLMMLHGWCRPPLPCNVDPSLSSEEQAVILYIDAHRADNGLPPLNSDTNLARSAQWKADDMASGNYINHDDPGLRTWEQRVRDCGYQGGFIGEDLAAGQRTAQEVERAWELSPDHNAILLGADYNAVGIGVADAKDGTRYWGADFGGP